MQALGDSRSSPLRCSRNQGDGSGVSRLVSIRLVCGGSMGDEQNRPSWRDRLREGDEHAFRPSTWKSWRWPPIGFGVIAIILKIASGYATSINRAHSDTSSSAEITSSRPASSNIDRGDEVASARPQDPTCQSTAMNLAMTVCGLRAASTLGLDARGFYRSDWVIRDKERKCRDALSQADLAGQTAAGEVLQAMAGDPESASLDTVSELCGEHVPERVDHFCQFGACEQ